MPISLTPQQVLRLEQAQVIWLASVRPNGTPHLVPIWFVWSLDRAFICTPSNTVKVRNLRQNPAVAFSLEDGMHPLILEGLASRLDQIPPTVAQLFKDKYDWEITGDETNDALLEITPIRIITW